MAQRTYYVYILSNESRTLYTDVTNSLERRMYEHRMKRADGFTRQYNVTMLVHVETFAYIRDAISREKEIKGWVRAKKIALIEADNPTWEDLSATWYTPDVVQFLPP